MPALTKADLLDVVVRSIAQGGWKVAYVSTDHPFRLLVYQDEEMHRVRVYIWNLTHGGGAARPQNEYRIQITGIERFEAEPGGKTVILGWWQAGGVFSAFDFRMHAGRLGASPSIQVRKDYLERAQSDRLAVCPKGNQELAVAFTPDFFVEYLEHIETLHGFATSESDLRVLDALSKDPDEVDDSTIEEVALPRRETLVTVRRKLRSARFQARVFAAYQRRCAFCGLQLELVQASHIVPVAAEGSTDDTRNGVCLCALHHLAYDSALVAFDESYQVMVNSSRLERLAREGLDDGREGFLKGLRSAILLPRAVSTRPSAANVLMGNRYRGWQGFETDTVARVP